MLQDDNERKQLTGDTYFGWQIATVVVVLIFTFLIGIGVSRATGDATLAVMAWLASALMLPGSLFGLQWYVSKNYRRDC